jgi:AraC family transcriptional activator of pobA
VQNYRPLLLQEIPVRLPGLQFRRLRLNRHLPDLDAVGLHAHGYTQVLLYLQGRGTIHVRGQDIAISSGAAVWIPPRVEHSFSEGTGRRPLCLVLDFVWAGQPSGEVKVRKLSASELTQVRQWISALAHLPEPTAATARMASGALILQTLDLLARTLGVLPDRPRQATPLSIRVERTLRQAGMEELPLREVARHLGYHPDYLNRTLRTTTGRTLREMRDGIRLEQAQAILRKGGMVREASAAAGFDDQNYFSRWFKKMTGRRPRDWQPGSLSDGLVHRAHAGQRASPQGR